MATEYALSDLTNNLRIGDQMLSGDALSAENVLNVVNELNDKLNGDNPELNQKLLNEFSAEHFETVPASERKAFYAKAAAGQLKPDTFYFLESQE